MEFSTHPTPFGVALHKWMVRRNLSDQEIGRKTKLPYYTLLPGIQKIVPTHEWVETLIEAFDVTDRDADTLQLTAHLSQRMPQDKVNPRSGTPRRTRDGSPFGHHLGKLLQNRSMSAAALATRIGVPQSKLSQAMIRPDDRARKLLPKIVEALNLTTEQAQGLAEAAGIPPASTTPEEFQP